MSSRADEPYLGETRAERRRRLQAEQWHGAQPTTPPAPTEPWAGAAAGPYDPRPYGVRAYPDIEDAVLEEYVEDALPPAQYRPQPDADAPSESARTPAYDPVAAARGESFFDQARSGDGAPYGGAGETDLSPGDDLPHQPRAAAPAGPDPEATLGDSASGPGLDDASSGADPDPGSRADSDAPTGSGSDAPTGSGSDAPGGAGAGTDTGPTRHVAHRAYGGAAYGSAGAASVLAGLSAEHPPAPAAPPASGPTGSRPGASGPTASGLTDSGPPGSGPGASGPTASEPTASGPTASGPGASGPTASEPTASEPTASEPTAEVPATAAGTPPIVPPGPGAATQGQGPALPGLADDEDPAAAAARLQLLAAQAAAERLARPRKAIGQSPETPAARAERDRRAAEKIAADKVAAARRAAVRAAAEQRESGAARAARLAAQTSRGPLGPDTASLGAAAGAAAAGTVGHAGEAPQLSARGRTYGRVLSGPPESRLTSVSSAAGSPESGAGKPAGNGASSRGGDPAAPSSGGRGRSREPRPKPPRKVTPRWAKVAYTGAALAVVTGGLVVTAPTLAALLASAPSAPATTPTGAASSAASSAAPSPTATGTAASGSGESSSPWAASSAMACDPAQWTDQVTGEAPEVFTASAVAQAYCLTAGTVRDLGFTDLAAKKATPYAAKDFAFVTPYLSPTLKTQWDKDVAELVKSQDIAGASGRRISALTTLAWGDRDGLKFDPAASARATDFAVGKPVTWVLKGSDGVNRLGVGFETGLVTHMVDGSGRKQDRILKRTYKILLVKGDNTHPWLIDAYEIGQSMAGLSTITVAPTGSASGAPAAPSSRATR